MTAADRMAARACLAELSDTLRAVRRELQSQIDSGIYVEGTTPDMIRDSAGRYVLLDGLAAKAQLVAALVQLS